MPQPTPYNRIYDFSDFQVANPAKPLPASALDAELDAVKLTTDQIRLNLGQIQRDDGKLANQLVTPESLSVSVLALIGQRGYNPRGMWATGQQYAVEDVVEYNLATFLCVSPHTASGVFANDRAAGRWLMLANAALTGSAAAVDLLEGDGTTTVFTLSLNYQSSESANVFVGGVAQIPDLDFTIVANELTFVVPPPAPAVAGRFNVMVRGTAVEAQIASSAALQAALDAQGYADVAEGQRILAEAASTAAQAHAANASAQATAATTQAGIAAAEADAAEASRIAADAAKVAAQAAQADAQAQATTATTQAGIATTKAAEADADRIAAQTARSGAESARDSAIAAKTAAESARDAANASQISAAASASSAAASAIDAANSAAAAQAATPAVFVGMIAYFPANNVSAPWMKANGATLTRADYPELWAYAQASGNLVAQASKADGNFGTGDGSTTFTLPDLRGLTIRSWDDGRGIDTGRAIGSYQADDNKSHSHTASTGAAGAHSHTVKAGQSWTGAGSGVIASSNHNSDNAWESGAAVGVGDHAHTVSVGNSGGTETRVKSAALLACIRFE